MMNKLEDNEQQQYKTRLEEAFAEIRSFEDEKVSVSTIGEKVIESKVI